MFLVGTDQQSSGKIIKISPPGVFGCFRKSQFIAYRASCLFSEDNILKKAFKVISAFHKGNPLLFAILGQTIPSQFIFQKRLNVRVVTENQYF